MEDLNTLYYFTEVVEHGGFAAAGRALDMPNPSSAGVSPSSKSAWACA